MLLFWILLYFLFCSLCVLLFTVLSKILVLLCMWFFFLLSPLLFHFILGDGFTDEDLQALCYEALKEIIPGNKPKVLVLRLKVWRILSNANVCTIPAFCCSMMGWLINTELVKQCKFITSFYNHSQFFAKIFLSALFILLIKERILFPDHKGSLQKAQY